MKYAIAAEGCDDSTIVVLDLSPSEARVIRRVVDEINRSAHYSCMPEMTMREAAAGDVERAAEQRADADAETPDPWENTTS